VRNGGQYLDRASGGTVLDLLSAVSTVSDNNTRWIHAGDRLYTVSADTSKPDLFYYLQYGGGFNAAEDPAPIRLYEQTADTTPHTSHTVTFDSNGGSAVAPVTVREGTAVTAPANPTRAGHAFRAWQLDGADYDFATPVNGSITLAATWDSTPQPTEPTYDRATSIQDGGQYLIVVKSTGSGKYYALTNASGSSTLSAKEVTLTGNSVDASSVDASMVWLTAGGGDKFTASNGGYLTRVGTQGSTNLEVKASTDEYLSYWSYSDAGKRLSVSSSSTTYNLNYSSGSFTVSSAKDSATAGSEIMLFRLTQPPVPATQYTVTFDSGVAAQTVAKGAAATRPSDPARAGHAFIGWLLDGAPYDFSAPVEGDITLTAAWHANVVKGDVTGDGSVSEGDARALANYLMNITAYGGIDMEAADINGDGKVTPADYTLLKLLLKAQLAGAAE